MQSFTFDFPGFNENKNEPSSKTLKSSPQKGVSTFWTN